MDTVNGRLQGELCTTSHGNHIVWDGHLCEGANLTPPRNDNFCLWTRCGGGDVPADKAHEGTMNEVECAACRRLYEEENGQFGVGA
jgi:hypothetical protein